MPELEKVMRKLEIGKFWERPEGDFPSQFLLRQGSEFLAQFRATGDPRFLNTLLKINDTLKGRLGDDHEELKRLLAETETAVGELRVRLGLSS